MSAGALPSLVFGEHSLKCLSFLTAAAALAGGITAASRPPALSPVPCVDIAVEGLRCAVLRVPEDRSAASGRTIEIHVAVAPAMEEKPLPDPVFFFYGGPGAAASDEATKTERYWRRTRARRDLVFIDQRGTGRSAPMHCPYQGDSDDPNTYAVDLFDIGHLKACRDRLATTHDLARYGTADAIRDADAVRAALGYERINVVGESYGTRVAQEYLRRYPERVRAAVLLGAVPPSASITEGMAASLDAVLEQFFRSCETDRACAGAHPDLRADTTAFFNEVRAVGVTATVGLDQGEARPARISYAHAIAWIRSRLYSVQEAARLPRILTQAARGDGAELVRGALRWRRGLSRSLAEGMYASVACAEDMPFVDVESETAAAAFTWLGDHRVASQQAACALWPRAEVAADIKDPVTAATPMLVINGDRDPATSVDWARAVVQHAGDARLVVARNRSHAMTFEFEACLGPIAERFLETADTGAVDDSCAATIRLPPFEIDDRSGTP